MTAGSSRAAVLPAHQVGELVQTLVKALRAFQMYLPNNPIYQRAIQNVRGAFGPVWAATDAITLSVAETDFVWEEELVYQQLNKGESLAWSLYKDGLRELTLRRGCEAQEVVRLLDTINRARFLPTDAGDDLLTLLWEQEFDFIEYQFTEALSEGDLNLDGLGRGATVVGVEDPATARERRTAVAAEAPPKPPGVVDLDDFDSTLYFLEDSEVQYLLDLLKQEYERDLRTSAIAAVLDIFETQPETAVRLEVLDILEGLFPNLLGRGEFPVVAYILREIRALVRAAPQLDDEQVARLEAFEARLSRPEITNQLIQALEESHHLAVEGDVTEVLRELRPQALETLIAWLPKLTNPAIRQLLQGTVDRLAAGHSAEVLRLLREGNPAILDGVVALCGRLPLPAAVPGLGELVTHAEPQVRLAVVGALDAIGSPAALTHIDRAIEDGERGVRLAAVRAAGQRGHKSALARVEAVVFGREVEALDLTERMAFFEAYGAIAQQAGLETLRGLLYPKGLFARKSSPETRACAVMALARIRATDAQELIRQAAQDKDLVVRNAANRVLRAAGG